LLLNFTACINFDDMKTCLRTAYVTKIVKFYGNRSSDICLGLQKMVDCIVQNNAICWRSKNCVSSLKKNVLRKLNPLQEH